jgi:uncharacterized linocin/CFP29 family protein
MKTKQPPEPGAEVMSATEVAEEARQIAEVLRRNLIRAEPVVRLSIPFSLFLANLDDVTRSELLLIRQRVEDRLATV